MITCKEATRLVSEAQDRRLGLSERIGLGFHLFICKLCRRYARQIRFLSAALRSTTARASQATVGHLDDAARDRIREGLKKL